MTQNNPVKHKKIRKVLIFICILLLIGGGVWWAYKGSTPSAGAHSGRGEAAPVALATIGKGDIDVIDQGLGTVTPLDNITVRTQINGQVQQIAFQEGQIVHKDDLLAQIDDRPYQVALEQAQGALERDQALLKEAELDLARYQKLFTQDSISKQQLDAQSSLVQQDQGNVATDQGQIDSAKLNIAYCHITAPITGRVGLRQVDVGNYAQTSDTNGVVVLTQLDPISTLFTLPEDQLPAIMKQLATGAVLQVTAYDRAGNTKLAEGKLSAVDNQINTTTGTVQLRAQFDNADGLLFPNQFVNIQLRVDTIKDAVLAPQAAILRGAPGTFVYLANDDSTVSVRAVKLGVSQGDNVQITDGLAEGDKVVVDGTDKLRDGAKFKLPETDNGSNEKPQGGTKHKQKSQ
jgi:multidrug efflux system membrane fusion protein